jgi:single-strand DNA-binding protein
MSGNNITVVGNITRDPELRFTPSGQANARLGVAVNRRWQDRNSGEWQEATSFFDVICWRELAENVSESLKRGTRVIVTGRLEQRTWEQEGNKRSVVEIIADEVAPSLRWATAKVEKTERRSGGDQAGGGGGGGFSRPAPAAEQPAPAYDDFGDEPC